MTEPEIMAWLLQGDVAIQYQVHRDLLGSPPEVCASLRARIPREGWGRRLLELQQANGHWGRGFYQPKWTSTHYTLMELRHLEMPPKIPAVQAIMTLLLRQPTGRDGGINYARTVEYSDICINGMILGIAAHFQRVQELDDIVDYLLGHLMPDGSWNCEYIHGATRSSTHTTISVLEGLRDYRRHAGRHRLREIQAAEKTAVEFLLRHQLCRSCRTGLLFDPKNLMLSFPPRWRYDILRALDYLQSIQHPDDPRLQEALEVLRAKRRADGRWPLQARHPGQTHFEMERVGQPSRWNTLRALRVLRHFAPAAC